MPDENVASPQPSPTPKPQGNSWKNIIIGVVIGAVLLGVGGFLIYNAYQPKSSEPTVTTTKKATPSTKPATPSAQKDETANWKTYVSDKYKFSFKYPPNYNIFDVSNLPCLSNTEMTDIVVLYLDKLDDKCNFVEVVPHNIFFDVFNNDEVINSLKKDGYEEVTIGGELAAKVILKEPSPPLTQIFFNHNGRTYVASIFNKDFQGNYDPIYDKILSTFRFD